MIPTLTLATERDVDLLLVEELTASEAFLKLIASRVRRPRAPANKNRPNPGLVVPRATLPIDNQGSFGSQIDNISAGISAANEIRSSLLDNEVFLARWRQLCLDA